MKAATSQLHLQIMVAGQRLQIASQQLSGPEGANWQPAVDQRRSLREVQGLIEVLSVRHGLGIDSCKISQEDQQCLCHVRASV